MKIFFRLLIVLLPHAGLSQRIIRSEVTPQHIRMDGTNIFLIPPKGFAISTQPRGLSSLKAKANIIVHGLKQPMETVNNEMSEKGLASQGLQLISKESITINGLKGYLIMASQKTFQDKLLKYTLIFGDSDLPQTHVVQCIFPYGDNTLNETMEQALLSTIYLPFVQKLGLPFSINFEGNGFAFWKVTQGGSVYKSIADGGIELVMTADHFIVKDKKSEIENIFYSRMKYLPYQSIRLDEAGMEAIVLDELSGIQGTIAAANENEDIKYIYQVLLRMGQHYFLLQGTSPTSEGLGKLKEVAKTFRKKKD